MKKTTKRVLLTAAAFSCMLNMNGCGAYGPPPDEMAVQLPNRSVSVGQQEDENRNTAEMQDEQDEI